MLSQKFFFAGVSYISSHCINPLSTCTKDQLASFFFPFGVILASHDLLFISKLSSKFSKTPNCLLWHLHKFWKSFGSERRVIEEITSLELFTCAYQVFINNYPGGCIPQLDAGSQIGIRSHLEIHDYIRLKKELLGDHAWLKMGLWRSILFHSDGLLSIMLAIIVKMLGEKT